MASNNACFAVFSASRPGQVEKLQGGAGYHLEIVDREHSSVTYRGTLVPAEGLEVGYIRQLEIVMEAVIQPIHKTQH